MAAAIAFARLATHSTCRKQGFDLQNDDRNTINIAEHVA